MNIPTEMTEDQRFNATVAKAWTQNPAALVRLDCLHCMDFAEGEALENGATAGQAVVWAASYLSQGDSLGCSNHN